MAFSNPAQIVRLLGLVPGATVVDFGAGSGHYTFAVAGEVGPAGKVYAIEILPDLAGRIAAHARDKGIKNVEVIAGDVESPGGSGLSDGLADVVFMANILFQLEERGRALVEAARVLKEGGQLIVIDWSDSFGGMGPQPEQVVPSAAALKLAEGRGFSKVRDLKAGDHHWGLVLRKK